MINVIEKDKCTGCKMCADICPVDAISYSEDNEGFWYPIVSENKCIKCGKCINCCPAIIGVSDSGREQMVPTVYSAYSRDDDVRLKSTSGGLFYWLANQVLNNGGKVCGCVYSNDYLEAYHIIGGRNELNKIVGSKYFQSDTGGIYKKIKNELELGNELLFCGSPCQVAALKNFLKKDYRRLTTVDFICRGINSPKVFRKYIQECEKKYHSEVNLVHLKNKKKGWIRLGTYIEFKNGKKYYRDRHNDPWVNGFVKGNLFMRPCCSKCLYKEEIRVSDISLGDFWGLETESYNLFKGVSLVLINTKVGKELFEAIKNHIVFEKRDYQEALKGNGCLKDSAPLGERRGEFFDSIDKESFEKLVWRLIGQSKFKILVKEIVYSIYYWIKGVK